ncbi:hypothetical protein OG946_31480 [Streptomyces sp. NBC_01808]|uniref:hypothetical protein n=1 Tax=Streptomyces sp. NBC_01808 TaxID=2975947 RepID=UPI002DDC698F|nr:hypothetical protein [Streptomyces sp. NBC_01808]WSA41509.1 hypothetical protein OG946_31480 [Streptomyces sp. NBC_01808]
MNKAELVVEVVFAQAEDLTLAQAEPESEIKGYPVAFLETFAYGVDTRSDPGIGLAFRVFGFLDGPMCLARVLEQPPIVHRSGEDEAEVAPSHSRGGTVHPSEKCGLVGA